MSSLLHPSGAILSTRTLLPFGATFTTRVAELCRCGSLDFDLPRTLPGGARAALRLERSLVPPAVLWVPTRPEPASGPTLGSPLMDEWLSASPAVVVALPPDLDHQMQAIAAAYRLADSTASKSTSRLVAVGLRSNHLVGGRRHLANLTLLRRRVEEWGLAIALDLTSPFDPLWEAEAAVLRLGGRLAVVRIGSHANLPSAVALDRVARRAVRAAIEQRRDVRVAIEPEVRWWQRRNAQAVAGAWTLAADRINPWFGPAPVDATSRAEGQRRHRSLPPR